MEYEYVIDKVNMYQLGKELNTAGIKIMKVKPTDNVIGSLNYSENEKKVTIKTTTPINEAEFIKVITKHIPNKEIVQPKAPVKDLKKDYANATTDAEKLKVISKHLGLI
tara:strand:+ start:480 stop:806 length:327 start_codon:yes stop_codon:yes gene_type:complete